MEGNTISAYAIGLVAAVSLVTLGNSGMAETPQMKEVEATQEKSESGGATQSASQGGDRKPKPCKVGQTLTPGTSCTYPDGKRLFFSVDPDGAGVVNAEVAKGIFYQYKGPDSNISKNLDFGSMGSFSSLINITDKTVRVSVSGNNLFRYLFFPVEFYATNSRKKGWTIDKCSIGGRHKSP